MGSSFVEAGFLGSGFVDSGLFTIPKYTPVG
jgi:hypothetical protein